MNGNRIMSTAYIWSDGCGLIRHGGVQMDVDDLPSDIPSIRGASMVNFVPRLDLADIIIDGAKRQLTDDEKVALTELAVKVSTEARDAYEHGTTLVVFVEQDTAKT